MKNIFMKKRQAVMTCRFSKNPVFFYSNTIEDAAKEARPDVAMTIMAVNR